MRVPVFAAYVLLLARKVLKQADAFGASPSTTGWFTTRTITAEAISALTLHMQNNDDITPDAFSRAKKNLEQENKAEGRFAQGDNLKNLRTDLETLRENLTWAEAMGDLDRAHDLRQAITDGENRDPELVYAKALKEIEKAKKIIKMDKKQAMLDKWTKAATAARACLPRFNLEGLWVGNFGDNGYEMINVTYSADTLIATKVTGDKSVPRGQVSFNADLSPGNETERNALLEPIELSESSASKWGIDKLVRYPGEGQVAAEGFVNNKFVDGQLIMFENHFSFLWIPTKHHVLFARPSQEVTIRMLRDIVAKEDEAQNMRDHLERCWDMDLTASIARNKKKDEGPEPFRRIMMEHELATMEDESLMPKSNAFSFWQVKKWKNYLDDVLRDEKTDSN